MYRRVAPFSVKSIKLLVTSLEKTNVPLSGKPKNKEDKRKKTYLLEHQRGRKLKQICLLEKLSESNCPLLSPKYTPSDQSSARQHFP